MPNISGAFHISTNSDVGSYLSAGGYNGAFYEYGRYSNGARDTGGNTNLYWSTIGFQASRSSSIYQNNGHVIPTSIKTQFYIKF